MFAFGQKSVILSHLRSREQLAHEHPEGPEVHGAIVTFVQDYLRSDVLGGPAKRPRLAPLGDTLREAKVHLHPHKSILKGVHIN